MVTSPVSSFIDLLEKRVIARPFSAILFIFIVATVLRVYCSTVPVLHPWDERYHAVVARNMMDAPFRPTLVPELIPGLSPTDWKWTNVWIHKPPLTLWLMSLSMKLFGVGELQLRLPSILLGSLGAILTFLIAKRFLPVNVAFIAGMLHATDSLLILLCSGMNRTDHPDAQFQVWIELYVFALILFIESRKTRFLYLAGMVLGFAILTKWLFALFITAVAGLFLISAGFSFLRASLLVTGTVIVGLLISLPWSIYTALEFPIQWSFEQAYNVLHVSTILEGHSGSIFYFVDQLGRNHGRLIYVVLVAGGFHLYRTRDLRALAILLWFILPFVFFSSIQTKMPAYITPGYPALFIIAASGLVWLFKLKRPIHTLTALIVVGLIGRESVMAVLDARNYDGTLFEASQLYRQVADNPRLPSDGIILTGAQFPIEAMFYIGRPVVGAEWPYTLEAGSMGFEIKPLASFLSDSDD